MKICNFIFIRRNWYFRLNRFTCKRTKFIERFDENKSEFHWNKIHRPVKYFYILRLIRGSTLRDVSFSKHLVAIFPRHITTGKKGERYWPSIELKLFSFLRCSIPMFRISVGRKYFSRCIIDMFAVRTRLVKRHQLIVKKIEHRNIWSLIRWMRYSVINRNCRPSMQDSMDVSWKDVFVYTDD